ncbi:MAG: ribonuclease P protein component [candidate division Zixibacteria bacterium]|nr:ribonuclease P protein component [candidate division Zixibacteria bacterium]
MPKDGQDLPSRTNRFPRACRLRGRTAIRETAIKGRKLSADSLGISYIESEQTRFGISVTRKFGNAVRRNRAKRLIREFLRKNKAIWPARRSILVRLARKSTSEKQLIEDLKRLLTKIK